MLNVCKQITSILWLSIAVAIGLPALMFIAIVIVQVVNPR